MKVLLVNKFHYLKGGAEKYYFNLAKAFSNAGDSVSFFSMRHEKNLPCEDEKYFVSKGATDGTIKEKLKLVMNMRFNKEAYRKMSELLVDKSPEVVIINNFHKHLTFSIVKAVKDYNPKLPILWVAHDLIAVCPVYTMLDGKGNNCDKCLKGDFDNCAKNRCARGSKILSVLATKEAKYIAKNNFYALIDRIICPSNFLKETLIKGGLNADKIQAIFNPLETDCKFEKPTANDGYLLYLGRLSKEKGVEGLIKAVNGTGVKLVIAGSGPEEESLKALALSQKESDIEFVGYKSGKELDALVDRCKFVCVPSVCSENCPYSVTESLSKGKPVIARKTGGIKELIIDGETGFLFENDCELKGILEKAFSMPNEEYLLKSEKALAFAKERFDATRYLAKLKKIIEEIK